MIHKTAHVIVNKLLLFCDYFGTMWTITE